MENIGIVSAILNESHLIVSLNIELSPNEIVEIVSEEQREDLEEKIGLTRLLFPKGQIQILLAQGEGKYLATIFKEEYEKKRVISTPSPFASKLLGMSSFLEGRTKEVFETKQGPPSALLNTAESLGLDINSRVCVGDLVMR